MSADILLRHNIKNRLRNDLQIIDFEGDFVGLNEGFTPRSENGYIEFMWSSVEGG